MRPGRRLCLRTAGRRPAAAVCQRRDAATLESIRAALGAGRGALARVRAVHEQGHGVPRRRAAHADAAPDQRRRSSSRAAARHARLEAAPPGREGHVPRHAQPVDVRARIHRGVVRVGAAPGRARRARDPRHDARIDVGRHRLHADPQLAQSRRPGAPRGRRAAPGRSPRHSWPPFARRRRAAHASPVAQILVDRQQVRGVRLESGEEIPPRPSSPARIRATRCSVSSARRNCRRNSCGRRNRSRCAARSRRCTCSPTAPTDCPTARSSSRRRSSTSSAPTTRRSTARCRRSRTSKSRRPATSCRSISSSRRTRCDRATGRRARETLERLAIDTVGARFPAFGGRVREIRSITPLDLEQTWGLTEGDLNHGQLILDQLLFMRPMPGWSDHRTPIDGLYLCGSGVHGGGGVSGVSGRNAARRVLQTR